MGNTWPPQNGLSGNLGPGGTQEADTPGRPTRSQRKAHGPQSCPALQTPGGPSGPGSHPDPQECSKIMKVPPPSFQGASSIPYLNVPVRWAAGARGGPGASAALPPAPRRGGDAGGGRPAARVSTVFTGSGDARARAFDAQSGALRRVFRGHAFVINCIQVGAAPPSPPAPEGGVEREEAAVPTPPARGRGPLG